MRIWLACIVAVFLFLEHPAVSQSSFPAGPNGFSFTGEWDCTGQFINGKPHHSHYSATPVLAGAWLQLSEKDIDPPGYLSEYLIRFDSAQKLYIDEDVNNYGYARYASPGWEDAKLIFTSTEAHYAQQLPENRFVYTVTGSKSFDISWESRRDKNSDFKSSDMLHCKAEAGGNPLEISLTVGQKIKNIFSRAIAFHADGIDDVVGRVSGTASYEVIDLSIENVTLKAKALYDGHPPQDGSAEYRDHGQVACWQGKCQPLTDASGPFYNPLIWGTPPTTLTSDTTWQVEIKQPWELGPPGMQTVTVVSIDSVNREITLKREGSGNGAFDNDKKQIQVKKEGKEYTVEVTTGTSHWVGYTTFQQGIVKSDELLVEREVTLSAVGFPDMKAKERQYILLNAAPL